MSGRRDYRVGRPRGSLVSGDATSALGGDPVRGGEEPKTSHTSGFSHSDRTGILLGGVWGCIGEYFLLAEEDMVTPERLKQVTKRCQDARLGYTVVDCAIYHRDVSELLKEREEILEERDNLRRLVETPEFTSGNLQGAKKLEGLP